MVALKILKERLVDLERISKMYQSTQVQVDILETKVAIAELEVLQQPKSCLTCKYWVGLVCRSVLGIGTDSTFCCNRYEAK